MGKWTYLEFLDRPVENGHRQSQLVHRLGVDLSKTKKEEASVRLGVTTPRNNILGQEQRLG